MVDRVHGRGVRGLLRRMTERSEPKQMAGPPRRIDRAGARRLMVAAGDESGVTRASADAGSDGRWTINAPSRPATVIYGVVIVGLLGASLGGPQHAWSSNGLLGPPPDSGAGDKESRMIRKLSAVGVVSMVVVSEVNAGDAVQWRVEDGGNGHWYQRFGTDIMGQSICWGSARDLCRAAGGELVSIGSQQEESFLLSHCQNLGGWTGFQGNGYWSSGEPVTFTHWGPGQPSGDGPHVTAYCDDGLWNDIGGSSGCWNGIASYTVEWSADCNHDGVVDYGQIVDGTFADANGNGVPDCCDQGNTCSTCNRYDLNLNSVIDGADLGILLAFWGPVSTAFPRADITADGQIDGADLGVLLSNWGPCPQ